MRVFAIDKSLTMTVFPSIRAFLSQCDSSGWCDPRYIAVASTKELYEYYSERYINNGIVVSAQYKHAHNMLNRQFLKLKTKG